MSPRALGPAMVGLLIAATAGVSHAERPVEIDSISADVRVTGRVARTRITYVLRNPEPEVAEGVFELELPGGAALLRLAMDTRPGQMMNGEITTPEQARAVYDTIVHGRRDPALLEHIDGDRFRLSAFPIPGRGTKTVLLVMDHRIGERGGRREFRLAMPSREGEVVRPRRIRATVRADGRLRSRIRRRGSAEAIVARWSARRAADLITSRIGDRTYFAAAIDPATRARPTPPIVAVIDTSASVSEAAYHRGLALIDGLARAGSRVEVIAGSTAPSRCAGSGALECVRRIRRGGATDLEALLRAALARVPDRGPSALLIVSDGVPSVGERDGARLADMVSKGLVGRDVEVLAVDLVSVRDGDRSASHLDVLAPIAEATGGRVIGPRLDDALDALTPAAITDIQAGEHLVLDRAVRPGEPLWVAGVLGGEMTRQTVEIRAWQGGRERRWRLDVGGPDSASSPRAHSLWARASLDAMERSKAKADALAAFSREHGVAGPGSSMLVLETEEDYRRWAIGERPAVVRRPTVRVVPVVHLCSAIATGDLDKNIIRRVIRQRRRAIRHCYNRALMGRPELGGTVVAQWVIDARGQVRGARIAASDLGHAAIEACVREQVSKMRFPSAKGGGMIAVRYPFTFRPPQPGPAQRARQRRDRIAEIEAGEPSLRRPALAGELADLYLREGEDARAAAVIAALVERHDRARRDDAELLAALPTATLRRRFAAVFRRAARARLKQPAVPGNLDRQLLESMARDAVDEVVTEYGGRRGVDPDAVIAALLGRGRVDLATRIMTRWIDTRLYRLAELYPALSRPALARAMPAVRFESALARVSASPDNAADLVASARTPAQRKRAAALIARQCQAGDRDGCVEWLSELVDQGEARRWLERRLSAIASSGYSWQLREAAVIHARLGRPVRSLEILANQLEDNPEDDDVRAMYDAVKAGRQVSW